MRRIDKLNEPISLTQFKINNLGLKYIDLANGNENVRIDIRESCVNEQFFLCAYCCDRITATSSHNEHIIPQNSVLGENLTLDYNNIVASCQSNNNCGHKKDNNLILSFFVIKNAICNKYLNRFYCPIIQINFTITIFL